VQSLGGTLLAAIHADPSAEILVVDGGSADGTDALAADFPGVRLLRSPAMRARQCNIGAGAARGSLLLFCHADTAVTAAGIAEMRRALADSRISGGSFRFALADACGRFRVTEWGANWRSRWMRLPFGDQGIFCRAADFAAVGGFPAIPLMDDVTLIRRLKGRGRFVVLRTPAYTSARRIARHGVVKSGLRNWGLLLAYRLGVAPERLARWYD
ncbi:MAG: TIGR04283 family arsenosugar biosynthesis glycosyltransferase, partial [Deltaproteobacteria bacterium]|nr:TIGR04283 family arsenosugar biosynthesis glycosyltransferase [Deltaproteobacteria bacterium]